MRKEENVLCFKMEAAGIVGGESCLVIRMRGLNGKGGGWEMLRGMDHQENSGGRQVV
jgi:hypothetical protein